MTHENKFYRQAGLVLSFTLLIRGVALYASGESLSADPDAYARLAVNYAATGVYGFESGPERTVQPTAFRPPLYPWILSFCVIDGQVHGLAVASLHLLCGIASALLTLSIGRRLGLRWAPLAAMAVALDPLLIRASQLLMTETLATLLALVAWRLWLAWLPPHAQAGRSQQTTISRWIALVGLGISLGLCVLCRPTTAPWAALCTVGVFLVGDRGWKVRLATTATVGTGLIACLAPWTLRNLAELGKPIWATSHGGYTLLLANNPSLYQHFVQHGPSRNWDAEHFHATWAARDLVSPQRLLIQETWLSQVPPAEDAPVSNDAPPLAPGSQRSELEDDALAYRIARATIARQPGIFGMSCLYRMGWLWALWPHAPVTSLSTLGIGLWYFLWSAMAVYGGWFVLRSSRWSPWLPALLLICSLTMVHAVYWSNMRMRGPLMPAVYLLAMAAIPAIAGRGTCSSPNSGSAETGSVLAADA